MSKPDNELDALTAIWAALANFPRETQLRMLRYLQDRAGVMPPVPLRYPYQGQLVQVGRSISVATGALTRRCSHER